MRLAPRLQLADTRLATNAFWGILRMAVWHTGLGVVMIKILQSVGGVILGTLLVALLGDRLAAYYQERGQASDLKEQLASSVISLTGKEAEELTVLTNDLAPQSYLVTRCNGPNFPNALATVRVKVCQDASLASILDEQERNLAVRTTNLAAESLQNQITANLALEQPGVRYKRINDGLMELRKLNSATTCGDARRSAAKHLGVMYAWVEDKLIDDLTGPDDGALCDFHGAAFPAAAAFVAGGLVFDASGVSTDIRRSSVSHLVDTPSDLIRSLYRDPVILALMIIGVACLLAPLLSRGNQYRKVRRKRRTSGTSPGSATDPTRP